MSIVVWKILKVLLFAVAPLLVVMLINLVIYAPYRAVKSLFEIKTGK